MRFERDDAKVGVLVLVAVTLFASLAFQRSLRALFKREVVHRVRLESVADLAVGTEVLLQGLRVGQVKGMEMQRNGVEYSFIVTLGLRPDVVLWHGTRGVISSRVVGGAYLELCLPPAEQRRVEITPGELIDGDVSPSLTTLIVELTSLTRNVDRAVNELRTELTTRGLDSIFQHPQVRQALADVATTLATFRVASRSVETTLDHGDVTLVALDRNLASLEKSALILQDLMERRGPVLDADIVELGVTLKQIQSASADFQVLANQTRPELDDSLRALHRTLLAAEELLELLKTKPNRLVLGTPSQAEREAARTRAEQARQADQPRPTPTP
jgi:ABC-type transporter Mla subunit MlaD